MREHITFDHKADVADDEGQAPQSGTPKPPTQKEIAWGEKMDRLAGWGEEEATR